jgi:ribosomal-protein-serine acetyltransferase
MFYYQIDQDVTLKLIDESQADELFTLSDDSRNHIREWLRWVDGMKSVARHKTVHRANSKAVRKQRSTGCYYVVQRRNGGDD